MRLSIAHLGRCSRTLPITRQSPHEETCDDRSKKKRSFQEWVLTRRLTFPWLLGSCWSPHPTQRRALPWPQAGSCFSGVSFEVGWSLVFAVRSRANGFPKEHTLGNECTSLKGCFFHVDRLSDRGFAEFNCKDALDVEWLRLWPCYRKASDDHC